MRLDLATVNLHVHLQWTASVRAILSALEIPSVRIETPSTAENLGLMRLINAPSNAQLGMLWSASRGRAALHGQAVLKQRLSTAARPLKMQARTVHCPVQVAPTILALKVKDASNTQLAKRLSNQLQPPMSHINHRTIIFVANRKIWPR